MLVATLFGSLYAMWARWHAQILSFGLLFDWFLEFNWHVGMPISHTLFFFFTLHSLTGPCNSTGALARSLSTLSVFSTRLVPSSYLVHVGMHPPIITPSATLFVINIRAMFLDTDSARWHAYYHSFQRFLLLLWTCWGLLCTVLRSLLVLGMGWGSLASLLSFFVVLHVWGRG